MSAQSETAHAHLQIFGEPFFLSIAESTQDCIRILDSQGRVVFMNARGQALFEITDWSKNHGRYWPSLWPLVSRAAAEDALRAAQRGEVARFRDYCPTARGRPRWWDTVVSPVRGRDGEGIVGVLATSHDVTQTMQAEAFLEAVVDNAPLIVFVKDADEGRFQLVNRAAEEVFGHSREEMLGKTDYDFFPAEQADFFRERDREVIASGQIVQIAEEPVTTADKGVRYFRTRKVCTYGPEGPRHLVCVSEDVTEERRAAAALKAALEQAEAASQAKGEFLANMSHEIRTPLNGVVGVADVLARTRLDQDQRDMVELIRTSGETLERLLSDVLDFARIESGQVELERTAFHLAETVREVARLQDLRACEKGLKLKVQIAPEAEGWRLGDMVRLRQVLTNLLSNAIKFTARGHVQVSVQPSGEAFRFEVRDTGVGFDPALKEQIFGRFQQADGSITRRFGGSGLGLAISRQLAERMGGRLDCDSAVGAGSCFFTTLEFPPAEPPDTSVGPAAEPVAAERPLRILLADDHAINRQVAELILAEAGAELVSVEDGRQAVAAFAREAFDLVLMDMQMPVMDGLTATRLLREAEQRDGRPRTPIAMLTANALPEHVQAGCEAGADRHISKPVTADGLLRAVVELTSGAGAEGV